MGFSRVVVKRYHCDIYVASRNDAARAWRAGRGGNGKANQPLSRAGGSIATQDPRLQRGLVVMDKAERVANHARHLMREVGIIAHSCGVDDPRELRRRHCRVVVDDGLSRSLEGLHPTPTARET